jgi:tRNA uridine 5-carboxymethylaminomethyl modification enzyme
MDLLGQKMTAKELLRRPQVRYHQIASLSQRMAQEQTRLDGEGDTFGGRIILELAELPEDTAEEVELQVKYENYVRKQEQQVRRTSRLEEARIPEGLDYRDVQHLRTEARQKLIKTLPRTVGQASRVEGVTPADIAILMVYIQKVRATKLTS